MKQLLITLIFILNIGVVLGQTSTTKDDAKYCETCKITDAEMEKTVSYHQYVIEEFKQREFDTMYMIQYAVVTEVISMPMNAMAMSFYTNEGMMYMIVSDRHYSTLNEAKTIAEQVKAQNNGFCNYFLKTCIIAKNSSTQYSNTVTRTMGYQNTNTKANTRNVAYVKETVPTLSARDVANNGNYRIQFSWTKNRPFETLGQFEVEAFRGGYRQVSKLSFQTKAAATNWLRSQGYDLSNFWVYPL